MNKVDSQVLPAPPNLIQALAAGFEAVSNHVWIIGLPVAFDLLLWLGPHLSLTNLVRSFFEQAFNVSAMGTAEMTAMMNTSREMWLAVTERYNLASTLRTFPVGIPSLMASRSPMSNPFGGAGVWQLPSGWTALVTWLLCAVLGLAGGTLYYALVCQACQDDKIHVGKVFRQWPWTFSQVFLLSALWLFILLAATIPFTCMLSLFLLGGLNLGRVAIILYGIILLWLLLPLAFSAHGIFVNHQHVWASIRQGIRMMRMTMPGTMLFLVMILVLSEGLDLLWRIPAENSWLSLVGVAGHAFVTSGLLASSFFYYIEANQWSQRLAIQRALNSRSKI